MNKSYPISQEVTLPRRRLFTLAVLLIAILAFGQLLTACVRPAADLSVGLGQETELAPGQTVVISGESLAIKFIKIVSDSRCPEGAQCIWAGEVSALIEVTSAGKTVSVTLTQSGQSVSTKDLPDYVLTFKVDPYPKLNTSIDPKDYRLKISVAKTPALSGGILATFKVVEEQYSIFVTNEDAIEQILALQRGESTANIPVGRIVRGAEDYNKPWSWHIDPEDIQMAEMSVEVSDGLPSYLEEDLDYWADTVRYFTPWAAELIDVKDYR